MAAHGLFRVQAQPKELAFAPGGGERDLVAVLECTGSLPWSSVSQRPGLTCTGSEVVENRLTHPLTNSVCSRLPGEYSVRASALLV